MRVEVDPNRIEGLADQFRRLEQAIGDQVMNTLIRATQVTRDVHMAYPECRSAASRVEEQAERVRRLLYELSEQLQTKEGSLRWTAGEYIRQEQEAMKAAEFGRQNETESQTYLMPADPRSYSYEDVLNRDDPDAQERLKDTYWTDLSKEEQDRVYNEIKESEQKEEKEWAAKMRRDQSGIGNQFIADLMMGGSNMMVNTINTASAGLPELLAEWIMGPSSKGSVSPLDQPYGKKAGEAVGSVVGFFLPFKYLKAVKTPVVLSKFSPTIVRSMASGAIFGTATELSDAATDFKKDGAQTLGERTKSVAIDTALAGAGDATFTFAFRTISSMLKSPAGQKLAEWFRRSEVDEPPKFKEVIEKPKAGDVEGTGKGVSQGKYDELHKMKPEDRYQYLLDKAKNIDVSTEKNQSIFYAGRVQSVDPVTGNTVVTTAREMAERYADNLFAEKGVVKLTLERTTGGKWMDDLKLYDKLPNGKYRFEELGMTGEQADSIWSTLSSRFADGASGAVTAFTKNVPDVWKPKTIFWSTEFPKLRNNPDVTHINIR